MGFLSVLSFAHKQIEGRLAPGDIAVDATVGTGADTAFLAKAAGPKGRVYGFDIQEQALRLAEERLSREPAGGMASVSLFLASHARMTAYIPPECRGRVGAVMFNLGYLPATDADKHIITKTESTLEALEASLSLLRPKGIITAVLYPGHAGGAAEAEAVTAWASSLPQDTCQTVMYRQLQRNDAPYVVAIEKKR
ncbi:class I SAM-dependent methyltransferase [Paenibacillus sp. FSL M7-1455]|jgi:predicted O-methyltransferase YrrM|uniref:SAM-dependent methyltransferase n=1 Tax=Paenibacillus cookii TaxID=157839 RepID=A0ABQ4LUT9_9BACL|nr:class I SAM-dependent methyltransferase [Paenibacillus cookii]GIO67040.1 SAM-dependent methyltransferase [Paenibacillus cookii]HWO54837.1 class I SAM-dependent methyltransferase [Paenibacillus cookii]